MHGAHYSRDAPARTGAGRRAATQIRVRAAGFSESRKKGQSSGVVAPPRDYGSARPKRLDRRGGVWPGRRSGPRDRRFVPRRKAFKRGCASQDLLLERWRVLKWGKVGNSGPLPRRGAGLRKTRPEPHALLDPAARFCRDVEIIVEQRSAALATCPRERVAVLACGKNSFLGAHGIFCAGRLWRPGSRKRKNILFRGTWGAGGCVKTKKKQKKKKNTKQQIYKKKKKQKKKNQKPHKKKKKLKKQKKKKKKQKKTTKKKTTKKPTTQNKNKKTQKNKTNHTKKKPTTKKNTTPDVVGTTKVGGLLNWRVGNSVYLW